MENRRQEFNSRSSDSHWQDFLSTITKLFSDSKCINVETYMLAHNRFFQCFTQHTKTFSFKWDQNPRNLVRGKIQHHGFVIYCELEKFLIGIVAKYRKEFDDIATEDIFKVYLKLWEDYQASSRILPGMCSCLPHWVSRELNEGRREIYNAYDLALVVWRDQLLCHINDKIVNEITQIIRKERNGECIDTLMISAVKETYVEVGVDNFAPKLRNLGTYKSLLEAGFLRDSEQFYLQESTLFLETHSIVDYMKLIEKRLSEEHRRISLYLHEVSMDPMDKLLDRILIVSHADVILNEFENLLIGEKCDDIRRLYTFFRHNEILFNKLLTQFKEHVILEGTTELEKCEDVAPKIRFKAHVEGLITIYKKYYLMINSSFMEDASFHRILHLAFSTFINERSTSSKSPEYLAKYCNYLLKQNNLNLQDQQLEDALDDVMAIFQFLQNKDIFQTFYITMLSIRLVDKTSVCDDAEASMISRLKVSCGFGYTVKLQKMFQDIVTSKDLTDMFKEKLTGSKDCLGLDFNVQVLCAGSWPRRSVIPFQLPNVFERSMVNFKHFYTSKYSGRTLNWLSSISRVELVTNCFKHRYTLHVNALQAAILLQFNDKTSFTVEQLCQNVQVEQYIALQIVAIFLKTKLLTSTDSEAELNDQSVINLFTAYRGKKMRLHLNVPLKTQVKNDEEVIQGRIKEDRKLEIEAAIVRVMKMRKTLNHQQLTGEVIKQLSSRFKPTIYAIKQIISTLIDKEYLNRGDSPGTYNYVA